MRHLVLTSFAALLAIAGCASATPRETRDAGHVDASRDAGMPQDTAADAGPRSDTFVPGDDSGLDAFLPGVDAFVPPDDAFVPVDTGPLPYPTRDPMRLKELQPDFFDMDQVAGNNAGGVAMNLVWAAWEPSLHLAPCDAGQVLYDGHCFSVDTHVDDAIGGWSARGLAVTAIVYGVPAWAHAANTGCSPAAAGYEIFCSPDDAADYARFAGMLAQRYDGLHGHGRVADFVIHNEVNSNDWFDVGCGSGTACDPTRWVQVYADNYGAAYDAIVREQSTARAYISFEHDFGSSLDNPSAHSPLLSVQTFMTRLAPLLGAREWRIAYHPYAPNLFSPTFGADDWPLVTYGNIGALLGWLHAMYPDRPHAWQVHLTESGINSSTPQSDESRQATAVCNGLRNILGTPGIEAYIYHRMQDNPAEGGLQLGLTRADGSFKPAWSVWALANRADLSPPMLSCGFENLPYTVLTRSYLASRGHWASSRLAPSGFVAEQRWRLLRAGEAGTSLLFSCVVGNHSLLTHDPGCEGQRPEGPVGYIYDADAAGRIALYRCRSGVGTDHFVSPSASCEGATMESLLGYALPAS